MNYQDRITELNFDTDNEESQKEARAIKKKLTALWLSLMIVSIIGMVASLPVFVLLLIAGIRSLNATILLSIIPLLCFILFFWMLILGLGYKSLARSIIIVDTPEEKKE